LADRSTGRIWASANGQRAGVNAAYGIWAVRIGFGVCISLFAAAMVLAGNADAHPNSRHKNRSAPHHVAKAAHPAPRANRTRRAHAERAGARKSKRKSSAIAMPVVKPAPADLPPALADVRKALELIERGKFGDATTLEKAINDPAARKLVEWAILRRADNGVAFQRYADFIRANPGWPSLALLRRRAETLLWRERPDAATVRRFFADDPPISPMGKLVLARLLMGQGDDAVAESEVRSVWRSAPLSSEVESTLLAAFPDVLRHADHVARMDRLIGAKDFGAAMRTAKRLGDNQIAIVKACAAAEAKAANGGKLLDAVPAAARDDLGYALCRIHWLMRHDSPGSNLRGRIVTPKGDVAAAAKLALGASKKDLQAQDTDEWWRERRALARKLLDLRDATVAYQVVTAAAPPANPYYRAEYHFLAGWIALRFLHDPAAASAHFARIDEGTADPRILARAAYWRGRAAEAAGEISEMRTQYETASRYPTAYYGQLARERLGVGGIVLRPAPQPATDSELVHAARILYAIGERDVALTFVSNLAKESSDAAVLAAIGQLTERQGDARATVTVGKAALARGMPLDQYAFPMFGIPRYAAIGPAVDPCIVYSVARTESAFDQRDKSSAMAVGLMQVTPAAGRDTANRLRVSYDWHRLVSDAVYNTQMGAAELAALLKEYRGSYILAFAAYNAGRGRVQQWIASHGDPRDPKIDPIDWVERIPFAETRNYVERVMENLQVYRALFGSPVATAEPALEHARAVGPARAPALVETIAH
jgi:soluble lytic murein transglycosylase